MTTHGLKVHGFDRVPSAAQKRRNEEVRFQKHKPFGGIGANEMEERKEAMSDFELALLEQEVACKRTPVYDRYGQVDKWKSLAKWKALPETKRLTAEHLASNYTAQQHATALGDGWLTDEAHQRERQGGIQNGVGINAPSAVNNNAYGTSAVDTGSGFSNSNPLVAPPIIDKRLSEENVQHLQKRFGLTRVSAVSLLLGN